MNKQRCVELRLVLIIYPLYGSLSQPDPILGMLWAMFKIFCISLS